MCLVRAFHFITGFQGTSPQKLLECRIKNPYGRSCLTTAILVTCLGLIVRTPRECTCQVLDFVYERVYKRGGKDFDAEPKTYRAPLPFLTV